MSIEVKCKKIHTCSICGEQFICKYKQCPGISVPCITCKPHIGNYEQDLKGLGIILASEPTYDRRNNSGSIMVGGSEVANTIQCGHCNRHWIPVKGSGKIRGFCLNCNKPHCGRKKCEVCIPYEKKLKAIEEGSHILTQVSVSSGQGTEVLKG